jgi:hypothetical protein
MILMLQFQKLDFDEQNQVPVWVLYIARVDFVDQFGFDVYAIIGRAYARISHPPSLHCHYTQPIACGRSA